MAKLLKLRRGTTTQHGSFTGAEGEVTIDTTKDTAVVHDGSQAGGRPLAREDMTNVSSASIAGRLSNDSIAVSKIAAGTLPSDVKIQDANVSGNLTIATADINNDAVTQAKIADDSVGGAQLVNGSVTSTKIGSGAVTSDKIADGAIVNADVNASAAIAGTKISPDFGSQNITTSGNISTTGNMSITNINPNIALIDSNNTSDFQVQNDNGNFNVRDTTNSANRLRIDATGGVNIPGNTDFGAGIDVTGNMTVTGTVDGRDVASDGSKLDGIESGATADQSNAEIRAAVEAASDSNVFTDADHTKLNGIEASATADQTAAEIRTLVESASDSNVFTDADHSKLNGIESGATADQTGSEIAVSVRGEALGTSSDGVHDVYNDGWFRSNVSGNGLYNQSTTQHFYSDNDDYWNIAGGGSANGLRFRDDHAGTVRGYVYSNNSNQIGFLNSSASWSLQCDNSGNVTATGNVTAYSDARLKTNVNTINDALSIVGKLRGVSFDWKESGKRSIGVIAQEVEKVLPELVLTQQVLDPTGESEIKSVDYGKIVGVLINAINELKEEVEELKNAKITG